VENEKAARICLARRFPDEGWPGHTGKRVKECARGPQFRSQRQGNPTEREREPCHHERTANQKSSGEKGVSQKTGGEEERKTGRSRKGDVRVPVERHLARVGTVKKKGSPRSQNCAERVTPGAEHLIEGKNPFGKTPSQGNWTSRKGSRQRSRVDTPQGGRATRPQGGGANATHRAGKSKKKPQTADSSRGIDSRADGGEAGGTKEGGATEDS